MQTDMTCINMRTQRYKRTYAHTHLHGLCIHTNLTPRNSFVRACPAMTPSNTQCVENHGCVFACLVLNCPVILSGMFTRQCHGIITVGVAQLCLLIEFFRDGILEQYNTFFLHSRALTNKKHLAHTFINMQASNTQHNTYKQTHTLSHSYIQQRLPTHSPTTRLTQHPSHRTPALC